MFWWEVVWALAWPTRCQSSKSLLKMKLKVLSKALICRIDLNNANHGNTSYGVPPFFIGSDTPILDVVLISDLTVSMDRFRLNLTGSYERIADVRGASVVD
ncbi:hypothetical protein ALT717_140081 [Alteromonas macleodii]